MITPLTPPTVLTKQILFMGSICTVQCDGLCSKAWGLQTRPRVPVSSDPDDWAWQADFELGEAPADPGTTEGPDKKPTSDANKLNRWCVRSCERSVLTPAGKALRPLPDWSHRHHNLQGETE